MKILRRLDTKAVLLIADTHGGHKLGLMNPDVRLVDEDEEGEPVEYSPALTATQKYLWPCFEEDLVEVKKRVGNAEVTLIHNGDIAHGGKYVEQLVSTRPADQIAIAVSNMKKVLDEIPQIEKVRLIHGTGAHTFGEGTSEILVARELKAMCTDTCVLSHGLFDVDGFKLDVAHHGPSPGIRNWTRGNQLRYYTRSVMNDSTDVGEKPPDALIRAHYHTYCHETVRSGGYVTEAFLLPAYSGLGGFARRVTRSVYRIGTGLLLILVKNGRMIGCHHTHRTVDLRTKESL